MYSTQPTIMSAVRYFDDVPHIVRYGWMDDEKESCWMLFWRNGTKFTITVEKNDVHGTAFYSVWRPLIQERTGLSQWHPLCDLLISHSMATLQRLAPTGSYWTTLRDYLHTPGYDLKLLADKETGNVYGEVMNGLEEQAAYEFQPVSAMVFRNMPKDIPQYASSDLVVLEKSKNWKAPPHKVRTSDGHVYSFKGCKRSSTDVETGEVTNDSLNSIEVYLKLFSYSQELHDTWAAEKSPVIGIVTDTSTSQPEHTGQASQRGAETLVAGILLSSMPNSQTLGEFTEQVESTTMGTIIEQSRQWKAQIEKEVAQMHSLGIYWGGREDWFYINQHTIWIDAEGQASLDLELTSLVDGSASEDLATRGIAFDNKAIGTLFDEWLPEELSKRR
jgi:hypothetical protein